MRKIFVALLALMATSVSAGPLPGWSEGYFYIHHISTGRGNATYFVFPDGTTMLIDAGEADPKFIESVRPLKPFPPRPDGAHSAAYWIADYIRQFAPAGRPPKLDYALITHFHTDHMGTITAEKRLSRTGAYRLAGITEVAELLPIDTLIDRAAPTYEYPVDLHKCSQGFDGLSLANYLSFAEYRLAHGQAVIGLKPGALDQIKQGRAAAFPGFHIRNIASSGIIWSGVGDETHDYVPRGAITDCHFDENPLSNVLTFAYGKFKYYSGGDIPGVPNYTQPGWRDVETPVSAVVGPVDVMLLDHHGNRDSTNENILRKLQPRVIVQENYLSPQPGEEVVTRMASKGLYPGPRDVFSTGMSPQSRVVIGPVMDSLYKSYSGHVVIRVAPGGDQYEVYVLNDTDKHREVVKRFGGYSVTTPSSVAAPSEDIAIKQARLQQNAAIAKHDVDAIASYWTDDVTICRGLGLQLAGKAAYRKLFEGDDPTSKDVIIYERIPNSIESSGLWPLAFETGTWKGHLGNTQGPVVIQGRYSAQWVKRADKWLIRSEVYVALEGAGTGLQMKAAP